MRGGRAYRRSLTAGAMVMALILASCFLRGSGGSQTKADLSEVESAPLRAQLEWVMAHLNEAFSGVSDDELERHFHATFLAKVPPKQFRVASRHIAESGPYSFVGFDAKPTETDAIVNLSASGGTYYVLNIAIESSERHLITGLYVQPKPMKAAGVDTWQELEARLEKLAPRVGFLAAEVEGNDLVTVHEIESERRLALGSAFKLYVLGEIASQISEATLSWIQRLEVEERRKSTGPTLNEKAGSFLTIRLLAERMISVSDNTATDHLLFKAGRENVERVQARMGHGDPSANTPFLSTREAFQLKLGPPSRAREYIKANEDGRRRILDERLLREKLPQTGAGARGKPRFISEIEWFASPKEISLAMNSLRVMGERQELKPVLEILSVNPGVVFDREDWTFIGFKGGSEPGVLNMTWLLQRSDGRWFTLTLGLNDARNEVAAGEVLSLMMSAGALLSRED